MKVGFIDPTKLVGTIIGDHSDFILVELDDTTPSFDKNEIDVATDHIFGIIGSGIVTDGRVIYFPPPVSNMILLRKVRDITNVSRVNSLSINDIVASIDAKYEKSGYDYRFARLATSLRQTILKPFTKGDIVDVSKCMGTGIVIVDSTGSIANEARFEFGYSTNDTYRMSMGNYSVIVSGDNISFTLTQQTTAPDCLVFNSSYDSVYIPLPCSREQLRKYVENIINRRGDFFSQYNDYFVVPCYGRRRDIGNGCSAIRSIPNMTTEGMLEFFNSTTRRASKIETFSECVSSFYTALRNKRYSSYPAVDGFVGKKFLITICHANSCFSVTSEVLPIDFILTFANKMRVLSSVGANGGFSLLVEVVEKDCDDLINFLYNEMEDKSKNDLVIYGFAQSSMDKLIASL